MNLPKSIHLWAPGTDGSEGGIQAYSASIVDDLRTTQSHFDLRVIARNDPSIKVAGDQSAGGLPSRLRAIGFAFLAFTAAWKDRPDLILLTHLHFSPLASLLKRLLGIPFAVTLHGGEAWAPRGLAERLALQNATALLPVSQFTADQVRQQLGLPESRFHLLLNTTDEHRFSPSVKPADLIRKLGIPANTSVIFSLGRLDINHRYKRMDSVIQATAALIRKGIKVILIIGGDGSDRSRLEALADSEGISSKVRFAGKISPDQLPNYYHLADVFALPSTGEGFGIVYLEALFSGLPVIAGNQGGAIEAVDHGRLGLALDPNNISQLANHLRLILERQHPHSLLNDPTKVREESLQQFGPAHRRHLLHSLLQELTHK